MSEYTENSGVHTKLNLLSGQTLRIEKSSLVPESWSMFETTTLFEVTALALERSA
jgi:hypothetical protein